ncbi:MAG: hypothetical protein C5B56_14925 [Proteobacteria bacterium]|nr:MAG: hypothetical protein C5B56_14925 [Pseudomonadota bacterium]
MLNVSRGRRSHLRLVHSTDVTTGVDAPRTDRQRFRVIEGGRHRLAGSDERAPVGALPREQ